VGHDIIEILLKVALNTINPTLENVKKSFDLKQIIIGIFKITIIKRA